MWDERYDTSEYVYGTAPNDFLASVVADIPRGRTLCIAEGEARFSDVRVAEIEPLVPTDP